MTAQELVSKLQIAGRYEGFVVLSLSQEKIDQLLEKFDPEKDYLVGISSINFVINHGDVVGSRGISYDFN